MEKQLLRLGWLAIAGLSCLPTAWGQGIPSSSGSWNGGTGAWSDQSQWTCSIPGQPVGPCSPNGPQFDISLFNGGTINVDTNITVNTIVDFTSTTLSLNGTSLTASAEILNLKSVQLTNGVINTPNLTTLNLAMQNSVIKSTAMVAGPGGTLTGTADISNSTIQTLLVGGTFAISNSSLGNNSALQNSGQSIISGTSFNGELTLNATGSVVMDNESKINSVLFGLALPVNVGFDPGSNATIGTNNS